MLNQVLSGFNSKIRLWPLTWVANTARAVGDIIIPTAYASHVYLCSIAGTSHGTTQPTWNTTNGGTTVDGSATFVTYDTKTYQVLAPQGSTFPYISWGLETDVPIGTFASPTKIEDLNFWVNVYSNTSINHLSIITDRVLGILDNASLSVTGFTSMKCFRTYMGTIIPNLDTAGALIAYQQPLRYRVMITS